MLKKGGIEATVAKGPALPHRQHHQPPHHNKRLKDGVGEFIIAPDSLGPTETFYTLAKEL